jgi:hypothetical protein
MGNSDNSPNDGKLSLDTSAPLWSAIMSDVSKGMPIARFTRVRPKGLVTMEVDAFTGARPGPATRKTVRELFIRGTAPAPAVDITRTVDVDAATGLLWRDGCAGPRVARAFIDLSRVDAGFRTWQRADAAWQRRAARGPGVAGPRGTRTAYFYGGGFYPYGQTWGGRFAPGKRCPTAPPPVCVPGDPASPCPSKEPPTEAPAP